MALNPFVSAVGFALPELISGATIVSIVLSLPMTGPLFLRALQSQDMYLAGAFVLMIGTLTIIGMLISDILLAWLDPRIRYCTVSIHAEAWRDHEQRERRPSVDCAGAAGPARRAGRRRRSARRRSRTRSQTSA